MNLIALKIFISKDIFNYVSKGGGGSNKISPRYIIYGRSLTSIRRYAYSCKPTHFLMSVLDKFTEAYNKIFFEPS